MDRTETRPEAPLTIAVIAHGVRGYPHRCLKALRAADLPGDTEFLLVHSAADAESRVERKGVRAIPILQGDRATARNRAVSEARGEFVLLVSACTVVRPDVPARLLEFLRTHPSDAVVSAQLLQENGMRRRTDFPQPTLWREVNLLLPLWRRVSRYYRGRSEPLAGVVRPACALHMTCVMGRRSVFDKVGAFAEGYRFACEDLEWCARAAATGVDRMVVPDAHAFKIAPQERGGFTPAAHAVMDRSFRRLVTSTRGAAYGKVYGAIRTLKATVGYAAVQPLRWISGLDSPVLNGRARCLTALLRGGADDVALPPDLESRVRWEMEF